MAIFTSVQGYFEISAIEFSPAVILPDQETTYTVTVKNVSGKRINNMYADMHMYYRDTAGGIRQSRRVLVYGAGGYEFEAISWAANDTKTFTGVFKMTPSSSYPVSNATRIVPLFKGSDVGYPLDYGGNETLGLMLGFTTDATFADGSAGDSFFNLRGENSEYLTVLDASYQPEITTFEVGRFSDEVEYKDEGENMLVTLALSTTMEAIPERLRLELRYRAMADVSAPVKIINLTSLMYEALASTIVHLISDLFDKNTAWDITLWFGDQYEACELKRELPRSFANVHLSGASTGGVCFGAFSQATEGKPLFQCYYPAHFYAPVVAHAGIQGVSDYSLNEIDTGGTWFDGKRIYRKVIEVGKKTGNNQNVDVSACDIETYVTVRGMFYEKENYANGYAFPAPAATSNTGYVIQLEAVDRSTVKITSTSRSWASGVIIIEYTKTTEEAS